MCLNIWIITYQISDWRKRSIYRYRLLPSLTYPNTPFRFVLFGFNRWMEFSYIIRVFQKLFWQFFIIAATVYVAWEGSFFVLKIKWYLLRNFLNWLAATVWRVNKCVHECCTTNNNRCNIVCSVGFDHAIINRLLSFVYWNANLLKMLNTLIKISTITKSENNKDLFYCRLLRIDSPNFLHSINCSYSQCKTIRTKDKIFKVHFFTSIQ